MSRFTLPDHGIATMQAVMDSITDGTLTHDQAVFGASLATPEVLNTKWQTPCGTAACVAGWILLGCEEYRTVWTRDEAPSSHPAGVDYVSMLVGVESVETGQRVPLEDAVFKVLEAPKLLEGLLRRMFGATNTIPELWWFARMLCGPTLTVPDGVDAQPPAGFEHIIIPGGHLAGTT